MTETPAGYMQDARGNLVPEANVKPEHKLEDELVRRLTMSAVRLNETLRTFRDVALDDTAAFRALLDERYDVQRGGRKGNLTLRAFDGSMEVQVAIAEYLAFGPELQAAKALIDECVERWSEGANPHIKALVDHAFQVNKQGRIDTHRVLGLRRLDIDDAAWKRAMEAIGDAIRVLGSKTYIRFYTVDPKTGARRPVPLDIAAV
jgi:hypothetical protein